MIEAEKFVYYLELRWGCFPVSVQHHQIFLSSSVGFMHSWSDLAMHGMCNSIMSRWNPGEQESHFLSLPFIAVSGFQCDSWCQVGRNNVIIREQCVDFSALQCWSPQVTLSKWISRVMCCALFVYTVACVVHRELWPCSKNWACPIQKGYGCSAESEL